MADETTDDVASDILTHPDPEKRRELLATTEDPDVLTIYLFREPLPELRVEALIHLHELDPEAVLSIAEKLLQDPVIDVRETVFQWLEDHPSLIRRVLTDDPSPQLRQKALEVFDEDDQVLFAAIARNASNPTSLRESAASRLQDPELIRHCVIDMKLSIGDAVDHVDDDDLLMDIARKDPDIEVKKRAASRISSVDKKMQLALFGRDKKLKLSMADEIKDPALLYEILMERTNQEEKLAILDRIDNQKILHDVVLNAHSYQVRVKAMEGITDRELLQDILVNGLDDQLREVALSQINDDDEFLSNVAIQDPDTRLRLDAARKIEEPDYLVKVALNVPDRRVRSIILDKLLEMDDEEYFAPLVAQISDGYVQERLFPRIHKQEHLADIVINNRGTEYRKRAFQRIDDPEQLVRIIVEIGGGRFSNLALEQLTEEKYLVQVALQAPSDVALQVIDRIVSQSALETIIQSVDDPVLRRRLAPRVEDQKILADLLQSEDDQATKEVLIAQIDKSEILYGVIMEEKEGDIQELAVNQLQVEPTVDIPLKVLKAIALYHRDENIKREVLNNIDDPQVLKDIILATR